MKAPEDRPARQVIDAEKQHEREERDSEAGRRATRKFWVQVLAEAEEQQQRKLAEQTRTEQETNAAEEHQEREPRDKKETNNAQRVSDEFDWVAGREAYWVAELHQAREARADDEHVASEAERVADEHEARARNQASSDAQLAQEMAERYE